MAVNMSLLSDGNGVLGLVTFVNSNSAGLFMTLAVLALFFILFMNLRKNGTLDALLVASFPCFIISVLLKSVGLINFVFIILFFVLTAGGVIMKFLEE